MQGRIFAEKVQSRLRIVGRQRCAKGFRQTWIRSAAFDWKRKSERNKSLAHTLEEASKKSHGSIFLFLIHNENEKEDNKVKTEVVVLLQCNPCFVYQIRASTFNCDCSWHPLFYGWYCAGTPSLRSPLTWTAFSGFPLSNSTSCTDAGNCISEASKQLNSAKRILISIQLQVCY